MQTRRRITAALAALAALFCLSPAAALDTLILNRPLKTDYYLSNKDIAAVDGSSVPAGNQVWLVAGGRIRLHGGFFVLRGARFSAVTGGIDRVPRPLNLDHDGIADWWELKYFGNLNPDGNGDFDNDGISDLSEYLMQTDPTNAANRPSGLFYRYDDLGRTVKIIRIPAR